jgi:hypothetical protein
MNEASWKRLLKQIRDGYVVPVVGPQLLVAADGRGSLQARVADRVLRLHGVEIGPTPLPPFHELHEAVSLLKPTVNLQDLYSDVHDAIAEETAGETPAAISQLSRIADFRLFVTLTPDDLLARSLRRRCAVNEVMHAPRLGTDDWADLPRDWGTRRGEAQVLYLFGKASSTPTFAIHDEDVLEYAHNIMANGSQVPRRFLEELRRKGLLLIGCNFPDWLSRFFLRVTNSDRLSKKDTRTWLIEPLSPTESLTCFLRGYAKDTEVLADVPPVEFVAELHDRWMREQDAAQGTPPSPASAAPRGALFFISYSRTTDRRRAEALHQTLRGLGLADHEIWFDRTAIEPGQDFSRQILDGIQTCRYFLPLLSDATNRREEAFVFSEWRAANQRRQSMNREFVIPVIVDPEYQPERYTAPAVRDWGGDHIDFAHAPDGVPDARTHALLQRLVREARRAGA